jgi:hypothetical protein
LADALFATAKRKKRDDEPYRLSVMLASPGGKDCGLSCLLITSVSEIRPGIVSITIVSFTPRFSGTTTSGHTHGPGSGPIRSLILICSPKHHHGGSGRAHGFVN